MRKLKITLKGDEAALIFRKSGFEMVIPEGEAGSIVPNHVAILMALSQRLEDEEFVEDLMDHLKLILMQPESTAIQ
jgi:hypothetical protein